MALTHISHQVRGFTRKMGLTDNLVLLERAWQAEIGPLESMARVVALDHAALVVEADSSPAVQELSLRRKELIRKMNQHFPSPFIKYITVRMSTTDGR